MATYTITLTDAQDQALSYVVNSQNDWIQNAVLNRCELAAQEIHAIALQQSLATKTPLPTTSDEIVALAFSKGWVQTGAQSNQQALDAEAAKTGAK